MFWVICTDLYTKGPSYVNLKSGCHMQRVSTMVNAVTNEHTRITFPATEADNDQYIDVEETPEEIFGRAKHRVLDVRVPIT